MHAKKFGRIHHLPAAQLSAVIDSMHARGLLGTDGWLTAAGRATKQRVEALTDRLAEAQYDALPHRLAIATLGGWHRRASFRRRVWLPAVAGDPRRGWDPIAPGLHFLDLRHMHKAWLIEDGVPEVVQCKRLGHRLGGVRGVYSHVTTSMVASVCAGLQARWEQHGSISGSDH